MGRAQREGGARGVPARQAVRLLLDNPCLGLGSRQSTASRPAHVASAQVAPERDHSCSGAIWQFVALAHKGRFPRLRDPFPRLERALAGWPLLEVGLIISTARVMTCALVTEDEKIIDSRLVETIANA